MPMQVGQMRWMEAGTILASGHVNTETPGLYVLSYNYTDAAGNAAQTVTRTIEVVDTTVPVIILNGEANITHEGGSPYLDANASWSDAGGWKRNNIGKWTCKYRNPRALCAKL